MIAGIIHIIDLVIILVLTAGVIRGFSTGAVRQVLGFAGVILAFVLAYFLMHSAGELVVSILNVGYSVAPLLGFVTVFLIVQLTAIGIVRLVEGFVNVFRLSTLNRLFGGVVGVTKALVLLSVFFLALKMVDVPDVEAQMDSLLYEPVATALPTAWSYVSNHVEDAEEFTSDFLQHMERHFAERKR